MDKPLSSRPLDDGPYWQYLGLTIEQSGDGTARVRLKWSRNLTQVFGKVHGGAIASLMDATAAACLKPFLGPGETQATIEMKVNFLTAATEGDLVGEAHFIRRGRTIVVTQVEVKDQNAALVAVGIFTFMIIRSSS